MGSAARSWGHEDVFEGATVAIDAVGDFWAEHAVVREISDRDFHFFWYVVDLEKQAKNFQASKILQASAWIVLLLEKIGMKAFWPMTV